MISHLNLSASTHLVVVDIRVGVYRKSAKTVEDRRGLTALGTGWTPPHHHHPIMFCHRLCLHWHALIFSINMSLFFFVSTLQLERLELYGLREMMLIEQGVRDENQI